MTVLEDRLAELRTRVSVDVSYIMWEDAAFWAQPEFRHYATEEKIDKIKTQFRESRNLIYLARAYVGLAASACQEAAGLLDHFDIDTAVGDQLTILGKALGWPRCHCAGQRRPVFGFACETECGPPTQPIGGFCEAEWDCGGPEYVDFCFTDDELYRGFLKARIVTVWGDYSRAGMTRAARAVFGDDAVIYRESEGVIGIAAGRLMTATEISIAHLYEQVLPVPPGFRLDLYHSNGRPFGFGDGWGGFCDGAFPVEITLN
jgi:hypothetical protein